MLIRWHHLRRSASVLHRLTLVTLFTTFLLLAKNILPYDNAIRLSVHFNTHKFFSSLVAPLRNDRWLVYESTAFPLEWADKRPGGGDVGIILKTGYGTRERTGAWLEALPAAHGIGAENVEENVVVVGDFDGEVTILLRSNNSREDSSQEADDGGGDDDDDDLLVLKIHDVVGQGLQYDQTHEKMRVQQDYASSARGAKYRTLAAMIAAGEDTLARNLSRTFGWELDAMKFIPALDLAFRTMPNKKWYLLVDDDTYLIQPSLNLVLSHFDPDIPHYLGNAVGDYRQRFAHGGSAIALSHAAMRELFSPCNFNTHNLVRARYESLTETWGDRLLARTLLRLGIYIDEDASRFFNGEPPWASKLRRDQFCVPVATFHRLSSPEEMRDVGRVFRWIADPVMWVDLWEMYGAPAFQTYTETPLRREWDHVGELDEQTTTIEGVKSAAKCSSLCEASKDCLSWTWELNCNVCHTSPWVTVGKQAEGKVSGLHVERTTKLADVC